MYKLTRAMSERSTDMPPETGCGTVSSNADGKDGWRS